jgi:hypothetical protein
VADFWQNLSTVKIGESFLVRTDLTDKDAIETGVGKFAHRIQVLLCIWFANNALRKRIFVTSFASCSKCRGSGSSVVAWPVKAALGHCFRAN